VYEASVIRGFIFFEKEEEYLFIFECLVIYIPSHHFANSKHKISPLTVGE
jgi:hypothetical protein